MAEGMSANLPAVRQCAQGNRAVHGGLDPPPRGGTANRDDPAPANLRELQYGVQGVQQFGMDWHDAAAVALAPADPDGVLVGVE